MATTNGRSAIICHDDVGVQRALGVLMQRCGFDDLNVVTSTDDAVVLSRRLGATAFVFDLALSGDQGITAVDDYLEVVPGSTVVVLSTLRGLRERVRGAGAWFIDPRDLRHVEDCILYDIDPNHPCR